MKHCHFQHHEFRRVGAHWHGCPSPVEAGRTTGATRAVSVTRHGCDVNFANCYMHTLCTTRTHPCYVHALAWTVNVHVSLTTTTAAAAADTQRINGMQSARAGVGVISTHSDIIIVVVATAATC